METRKTNLGVEYELELSEVGTISVKVIATLPQNKEWEEFEVQCQSRAEVQRADRIDNISFIDEEKLQPIEQFINEQAIIYVSMELAKLMGEGKCKRFSISSDQAITATLHISNSSGHCRSGLPQIEELIKQIRYSK